MTRDTVKYLLIGYRGAAQRSRQRCRLYLGVAPGSSRRLTPVLHSLPLLIALLVDELSASRLTDLGLCVLEGSVTLGDEKSIKQTIQAAKSETVSVGKYSERPSVNRVT